MRHRALQSRGFKAKPEGKAICKRFSYLFVFAGTFIKRNDAKARIARKRNALTLHAQRTVIQHGGDARNYLAFHALSHGQNDDPAVSLGQQALLRDGPPGTQA
jgi:hypothetical protein